MGAERTLMDLEDEKKWLQEKVDGGILNQSLIQKIFMLSFIKLNKTRMNGAINRKIYGNML